VELAHELGREADILIVLLAGVVEAELVGLEAPVPNPPGPPHDLAAGDLAVGRYRPRCGDVSKLDDSLSFLDGGVLVEERQADARGQVEALEEITGKSGAAVSIDSKVVFPGQKSLDMAYRSSARSARDPN
jgi:hypothetical protein